MNLLRNVANSVESCHRCHCKSVANFHDHFCQQTDASMERKNKIMSTYICYCMISHRIAPSTYPGWLPFKGGSNTPQATSNPHHERFSSPQCSTNHFYHFCARVRIQYGSAVGSLAAKCLSGPRAPVPISELVSKLLRGRCPPNGLRKNKTLKNSN
jgi:hypothetical protein